MRTGRALLVLSVVGLACGCARERPVTGAAQKAGGTSEHVAPATPQAEAAIECRLMPGSGRTAEKLQIRWSGVRDEQMLVIVLASPPLPPPHDFQWPMGEPFQSVMTAVFRPERETGEIEIPVRMCTREESGNAGGMGVGAESDVEWSKWREWDRQYTSGPNEDEVGSGCVQASGVERGRLFVFASGWEQRMYTREESGQTWTVRVRAAATLDWTKWRVRGMQYKSGPNEDEIGSGRVQASRLERGRLFVFGRGEEQTLPSASVHPDVPSSEREYLRVPTEAVPGASVCVFTCP